MKKSVLALLLAITCALSVICGGCFKNGSNATVNNNYGTMSDEQFRQFLDSFEDADAYKMQVAINRSLMSGVSILSTFEFQARVNAGGMFNPQYQTVSYHSVACGSGVIIDLDREAGDAYVITNCHVVYSPDANPNIAQYVYLYLHGQDTSGINYNVYYENKEVGSYIVQDDYIDDDEDYRIEAEIVGAAAEYDIALLKVTGSEVLKKSAAIAAEFAESDDVRYGQQVYAIGNPEGEGMAATSGVISKDSCTIGLSMKENPATEADINYYRVIRTDAAINGGNSGGGMYNTDGKLVGIVNSKSVSEEIDNMGYALPGGNVKRLWQLMKHEYENGKVFSLSQMGVTRAYLPVQTEVLYSHSYLDASGMAVSVEEVCVSSSEISSLSRGDVIKRVKICDAGGNVVEDSAITREFQIDDLLLSVRAGYKVTLTIAAQNSQDEREVEVPCNFSKTR